MQLDPQSQAIVDAINGSGVIPFHRFDPAEARARLLALRPSRDTPPEHEMHSVTEETITTPDGGFRVRILQPSAPSDQPTGVVLYYHGGGFFAGGLEETDAIVRRIAKQANVTVINVDYRLSPEVKFPVAVNDSYAAIVWAVENAARLGIDPDKLILAGDSAGGNLAIVLCLMARENGGPAIRFQVPIYPSLDLRSGVRTESRVRWGGGDYFLINDDVEWMMDHYFSDRSQDGDWRASPITAETYRDLPPALVVTASHDPLLDEGRHYAERLKADGVQVEYAQFDGTFHGFVSFAATVDAGDRAMDLICNRIAQAASRVA